MLRPVWHAESTKYSKYDGIPMAASPSNVAQLTGLGTSQYTAVLSRYNVPDFMAPVTTQAVTGNDLGPRTPTRMREVSNKLTQQNPVNKL